MGNSRINIINTVGVNFHTSNIEAGEYSYVLEAGSKENLIKALGRIPVHFKLDIRFEYGDVALLIETKQNFTKKDEEQLAEYVAEERALHCGKKIIAMLANTNNSKIKVWKSFVNDAHLLKDEKVINKMEYYVKLFHVSKQNNREAVLKNTYNLNELLHKMDIDERLRSQFVGTTLLYIKDIVEKIGSKQIDEHLQSRLKSLWSVMDDGQIRAAIKSTLGRLLDGSDNKQKKISLLEKNVLEDQKVQKLTTQNWIKILDTILMDIYRYIDIDSSEGQDILNLFFIAFNKYTGKADKNQAFTPDHITEFMCRLTEVDRTKRVLDITCGSGSFLVQAMVKELADCRRGKTEEESLILQKRVKEKHIYGIENEEKAYGLATTNMLIHGDGNSNIKFGSCFEMESFIKEADPDIVLMNPPYNAKPVGIPDEYKRTWGKAKDGKEDPTKGLVFIRFLSDIIKKINIDRERNNQPNKTVKLAVLLPVSAAIGTSSLITEEKKVMLEHNTLEAVFTLPNEIFYPGASVVACCMLFTLGKPHVKADGTVNETFFGYCKDDGFKKKKNLGRIEQFDADNNSKWKFIENEWLSLFNNKRVADGKSAMDSIDGDAEWLCEAYMKTDYNKLTEADFQQTLNNYLAYLVRAGRFPNLLPKNSQAVALDVSQWEEFKIGDFFDIHPTKFINGVSADDCSEYGVPLVVNSAENNGVVGLCELEPTEQGKIITFSDTTDGNTFFYQDSPFIGFAHVQGMYPKTRIWSKLELLFFSTILMFDSRGRYNYGRKMRRDLISNTMIKLPVDKAGEPDWKFMEDYIKSLPYGDCI